MLPEQQQRIMGYFIEEAKDHLNTIEQGLLNLQGTLQDQEMVNEVFRAAHSVKGGAAMLGIGSIQKTAHRLEDYFKVLKEEERPIQVDQKLESLFLQVFDALHELLEQLQGPFGLTEDVANGIMSGVEPVFEELHNHLEHLVHQGVGAAAQPTVAAVAPSAPPVTADPVLVVFQGDVATRLRDLLQAFKQAESAQSRQQLQDLCAELKQLGNPFSLTPWCELLETARQAIACPDNSYRTLAPIVIKEIKQAQDLVLAQRASEVVCSDRLRELVPVTIALTATTGEADLADLFEIADETPTNVAVDDLFTPSVEVVLPTPEPATPVVASTPANSGFSDYGFGDDLTDALDFEQPGPEVGMAELNSLADLFEGEVLDLGATWQEEEVIGTAADIGNFSATSSTDLNDLPDTSDFSDLLSDFDEDESSPATAGLPQDDLVDLFGDASLLNDAEVGSSNAVAQPTASVTDEIDALFGDDFLDLEAELPASPMNDDQASADNLGELFSGLDETEELAAAPDDFLPAFDLEAQSQADGLESFSVTSSESEREVSPELLVDDLPQDLFSDAPELADGADLGDLDLELFGDDGLLEAMAPAAESDLPTADLEDLLAVGDSPAAVDSDLNDFFLADAEELETETPTDLNDFFLANTGELETEAPDSLEPDSLEIEDPWAVPSSTPTATADSGASNSLEDEFATVLADQGSVDLADDLFGLDTPAEVENSPAADVLDETSALDFDLASLSGDLTEATAPNGSELLNEGEELLPDFNFDVEDSLRTTPELAEGSESLDFLLEAADLAEITTPTTEVAGESAAAQLDDFWADGSEVAAIAPESSTTLAENPPEDWLGSEGLDAMAEDNFSGSLDSLFDETSEDFGSLDLDSAANSGALTDLGLSETTPTAATELDTTGLFELQDSFLDSGFEDMHPAPELSLEDMGETPDLAVDLFGIEGAEESLPTLADDGSIDTAEFGENFPADVDLFAAEGLDEAAGVGVEPLELLSLTEMAVSEDDNLPNLTAVAEEGSDDADLDALLTDIPMDIAMSDGEFSPDPGNRVEDEFADLDALLGDSLVPAVTSLEGFPASGSAAEAEDDFADLEALLGDASPVAPPAPVTATSAPASQPVTVDSEFDDLEKLLEDADKTMGGSPTVKNRGAVAQPRRPKNPNVIDQTMRVPVKQLDNLSNLVGELVVNRNSLEQDQERLRQFLDNLLYQVQQLSDVGQRMRDLYERSLLESSLLASRQSYQSSSNNAQSHSTGASFDALEMDRFTGFHSLSQEMIELIVRVRESSSDIEFIIDETDQVTRNFRQVTTQLQEGLTRSRMVPFAQTADRLPRGVRDNAIKCGKQAELVVEGRETLIDKMILEQLYDPLNHLVNNAIAHGIETPEVRQAAGKPPVGRVTIRAFYQGNQTVISVSDDGAGIDPDRIKAKAIEKKLITPAEAKTMSRLDVYDILFAPGFSGADEVTDLAGRGVGMDVVRTRLNEIRGTINTDSTIGKGTTFTIRLPLTLSISKALCCISNRARIAFPMDGVEDMLDVPKERIQTNAEGQSCILWRDLLLPFQSLSDVLKYSRYLGRGSVYGGNQEDDIVSIVVLRSAGNFIALQVDQVLGEQEIVIKQLEGPVPKPVGVAGATVLGDGRIMPIADVLELIDLVQGRIRHETSTKLWEHGADQVPVEPPAAKTEPTVLIVDDSITVRELLSMTFNKVGYRVEQARDGQEAWEKLRSGLPCDMVFCDIEMPRMDGLELLSRIQKDGTLNHLPIAMLTSRGADRHRQMAVQLGARGYFTKPYLEEALLDAAQRMLKGEVLVTSGSPG